MDAERWKLVDSLLEATLGRPRDERDAFLRQACVGDESLEPEIRSLLAAQEHADSFLERPAIEVAARAIALEPRPDTSETAGWLAGQTVSHYRIVEKVGAGGMGVVYKAEDIRLHRFVALKFLPEAVARDADALRRFQRESRAASALNHPNICTIHDIGEQDGRACIVMEYLDGTTLKHRIGERPVGLDDLVRLGIEIAEALEAAHAEGITHRDIKSANIFLTQRGVAKVLDFGLAQVASHPSPRTDLDATAAPTVMVDTDLTSAGSVLGTVAYMSPEQVRAEPLDVRTDLFSFGVVLYEMATGTLPFVGDSSAVLFASILNDAPVPLAGLNPSVPEALARIIDKCLEKDRDRRYQRALEIRTDLQRLQRERDSARFAAGAKPGTPPHVVTRWRVVGFAAVAVLTFLVAGYFYFHRRPQLSDKDTIVLADFDNKTGDPVFDDTLRQGLSVELQQSPFLTLISDKQVQQTLALMGQPKEARLTSEMAQQICERTASAMVLEGSIASLGSQYVLGLRARNCNSGNIVDQQQVQVARREDVLNALSHVARKLRIQVGESLTTVEKHSTPLAEATTPSLEALKAYSTGMKVNLSSGNAAAIPSYRRAVEIDPNFAMAYADLGLSYSAVGESVLSAESTTKAWQLRDRVSDREKFFIDFTYDRQVTGNLDKAYQTLEVWLQTYPRGNRDPKPQGLVGGLSTNGTGRFKTAIDAARESIATDPGFSLAYGGLAADYFYIDRFGEAESALRQATERKVEDPSILVIGYNIAVLKGDKDQMDRTVALAKGRHRAEHQVANAQALALARSGRLQLARQSSSRAIDLAGQEGQREVAASYQAARAVWEAECGNATEGKRNATAALALSNGRDVEYAAGLALALSGDAPQSQPLADDLDKRFPEDTFAKFTYVPVLRALSALERGMPADSVERLQISLPYEPAVNGLNFNFYLGGLHSAYVRGEAFVALHRYAEAAAEFQKILDHRGIVGADPIGALAHLQLGRSFALAGDLAKSKTAYQDFLALWKNADSDIPILQQAKAEYAKLQ